MKHILVACLTLLLSSSLVAKETTEDNIMVALLDTIDTSTPEGADLFFFANNGAAFLSVIYQSRHFSLEQRLALAASWLDAVEKNDQMLTLALGIDHPFGPCHSPTRERQLEYLEKYGYVHDIANQVAWFLLTSSNDRTDYEKARDILRSRTDLDHASYDTLGYAYHKLGQYDDALQAYFLSREMLSKEDPLAQMKLANVLYHMGTTLLTIGKHREAYLAWGTAVKELKEYSNTSKIDFSTLLITLDIDYPRLMKQMRALQVIVKKEETRADASKETND